MIDLATAKAHLRIDTTDEDSIVQAYLSAAQGVVQKYTGKLLTQQPVTQTLAGFPGPAYCGGPYSYHAGDAAIRLFQGPVADDQMPTISYVDSDGNTQTLADFRLVEGNVAKLLPAYGAHWPAAIRADGSVTIAYTAGYASGEVPPEIDQAVLLLTGHYYANREAVLADTRAAAVELPLGIELLLANYCAPGIA